ncbi:MAG: protein phosphatase 2C domain-containing protein, partial [Myxococcales bacterium]|nr:protein phosphatase 2C domain-containing protein [Myxococcales bacterium]
MTTAARREQDAEGLRGAHLFCQQEMTGAERIDVAGGQLAVFSRGNPARERVNQDAAALLPVGKKRLVLVVADGVGGARSGARASSLAVEEISRALAEACEGVPERELGGELLRGAILNGIERANAAVKALGLGAGTTLAIVAIDEDRTMRTFHVGDSTVVVVGQRGRVKLQTVSHSPVGYAVEAGLIDDEDALHHPDLHLISNMVGSERMRIEVGAR